MKKVCPQLLSVSQGILCVFMPHRVEFVILEYDFWPLRQDLNVGKKVCWSAPQGIKYGFVLHRVEFVTPEVYF